MIYFYVSLYWYLYIEGLTGRMTNKPQTKLDWLIRFRRAKTQDTLDFMLDRALEQLSSTTEKAEAILAHAARQDELDMSRRMF